jgi:hypothetical protein
MSVITMTIRPIRDETIREHGLEPNGAAAEVWLNRQLEVVIDEVDNTARSVIWSRSQLTSEAKVIILDTVAEAQGLARLGDADELYAQDPVEA